MVEWTDAERSAILGLWGKLNIDELGPQALARYHCITFFGLIKILSLLDNVNYAVYLMLFFMILFKVSDRVSMDSEIFRHLWKPVKPRCHHG